MLTNDTNENVLGEVKKFKGNKQDFSMHKKFMLFKRLYAKFCNCTGIPAYTL